MVNQKEYKMANPHPNTSGLKPFNQMTPEEALVIQRMGGIAHAQRNAKISEDAYKLTRVLQKEMEKYLDTYDPDADIFRQLVRIYYNPDECLNERLKAKRTIDSILAKNDKRIDEQNKLQYKTATKEFQLSQNYPAGFREGGENVQYAEEDRCADKRLIDNALKEEKEWEAEEEAVEKANRESVEKESNESAEKESRESAEKES